MDVYIPSYGETLRELATDLDRYGHDVRALVDTGKVDRFRSAVDRAVNRARTMDQHLKAANTERRTLATERSGFNRGLELIAMSNEEATKSFERLTRRVERHSTLMDGLAAECEALDLELKTINVDLRGSHVAAIEALEVCVEQADRIERERAAEQARRELRRRKEADIEGAPMWSPTALPGYRVWTIDGNRMDGSWKTWMSPTMDAVCSRDGDVPHTSGVCDSVGFGCGVYAAKESMELLTSFELNISGAYAVGVVALEGRVIEHKHGYRASKATVMALITADTNPLRLITDPVELAQVFEDPLSKTNLGVELRVRRNNKASFMQTITEALKKYEPGGIE